LIHEMEISRDFVFGSFGHIWNRKNIKEEKE
jgi:hypothetical protein